MLTLSFGFLKPETGDKGSVWFPALEDDIQQLNDHTHDGITSSKLTAASITGVSGTIAAASWSSLGGGNYRQSVTTPAGVDFDDYGLSFRTSTGVEIQPTVEKITDTTYYVYVNDNTLTLTVLYLV